MLYRSVDEAQAARLDLVERIQQIDVQLSERAAEVSVGRVPDAKYKQYLEWKSRALKAKAHLVSKLARTKMAIAQMRTQLAQDRVDGGTDSMLRDLHRITKGMLASGARVTPEDQQVLDDVQIYLRGDV